MRKISNLLIVFILICLIVGNVSTVYGEKSEELEDIKDKAFDLGYKDGEKDGSKYFKDTPYYKVLPNEDEIIYIFKREYRRDYDSKYNSTIIRYYEYGFEEGYNSNVKDDKDKKEDNLNYPKTLGRILGEICGYRDFYDEKKSNWSRAIPSDRKLREMYNLDMETSRYRTAFLGIFKDSFEEGYKVGYEKANLEPIAISYEQGIKDGTTIGQMKGEYAAIIDITLGNTNYWTRHKIKDSAIIDEYGLKFQSDNYQMAFVIGYWEGFIESYNETYNKVQLDRNKVKTYTERIPIDGKNNIGIPGDDKFLVDIEPGTYYNDVIVTIDSIPTSYVNPNTNRHTQASGVYSLKIMNLSNKFDDNKKTTIKFKSYGNNIKYGIYKYHYNKWVYIPSRQEGDYLVADINLKNIDSFGNVYVVRVDNELPLFYDSRGHWAKDEINTYVKREIIYGYPDETFRPNEEISRREFVTMLSRLYDWFPPYDSSNITKFKDYREFGYAEKAISYATYYGIVNGYSNNTFRPHNPITYKEVEQIMSKVLKNNDFKWDYFAEKMIYENGVRSKSKDGMNNRITRAEFVFMLHRLNEWQY